jgi:hypothetical protein
MSKPGIEIGKGNIRKIGRYIVKETREYFLVEVDGILMGTKDVSQEAAVKRIRETMEEVKCV